MGAQHTPGPWRTGPSHVVQYQWHDEQNRRCTSWIAECVGDHPPGEIEANARLIAAAPELLAACELIDAYLYATARKSNERQIVQAAIARATGDA